jgi:hypothetical protein
MFDPMENNFKSPVSTISPRGQGPDLQRQIGNLALKNGQTKPTQKTGHVGTVTHFPAQRVLPLPLTVLEPAFQHAFWAKVNRSDGCWEWTGMLSSDGYGRLRIGMGRAHFRAHRISYFLAFGTDPGGMLVCHSCDNPKCVRPGHLFLGSPGDNAADKVAKGRHRWGAAGGAKNPNAKMGEDQAREVVTMLLAGMTNTAIAAALPVGHSLVSRIRVGKAWRDLSASMGFVPTASKMAPKSGRTAHRPK